MIFKVTSNDVFEDNPELKSLPEFENLSSRDMKYVIFVCDYKSPFRALRIEERKRKAALEAGFRLGKDGYPDKNTRTVINGEVVKIELALKKYQTLQHDSDREIIDAITSQIDQIVLLAKKKDKELKELEVSIKLSEKLPSLTKARKEIIDILEIRDLVVAEDEIDTDELIMENELSTLDKFNAKRK